MLRRTAVVVAAVVGLTLALAGTAAAHPLGNFTVNRYAGIDVAGDTIFVRYALDLAEIPAFQLGEEVPPETSTPASPESSAAPPQPNPGPGAKPSSPPSPE